MPDTPAAGPRLLAPAQVADLLGIDVGEVISLIEEGRLVGMRVGSPARWRVDEASVASYLDDQAEEARRMALWRQSNAASFPELWGTGAVRNPD
ncbi:helix-turn-helix domain-containing protein [Microbacterium xanthum]|uniref:helix-turn-helix domain-containing protein n=1 Tax=Microbacterium xanthum TaxID=3079794 RepID=UPI002AD21BFC|nr:MULTISPECIES: helix-turn-helix domain-containing protein [unclassified Microbacterium]MDZ8171102.1 helix-turn-helix domain-containing protein [Microbacterium sp. KSW-48]MDZ8201619.1 helix-turn-helix domain-containing protein [Microbacterium sp. SSW1-59]